MDCLMLEFSDDECERFGIEEGMNVNFVKSKLGVISFDLEKMITTEQLQVFFNEAVENVVQKPWIRYVIDGKCVLQSFVVKKDD